MTRNITIKPVLNGFVCQIDCQTIVFTDKQTMLTELSAYYDKPCETEQRYWDRAVNKTKLAEPPVDNSTTGQPGRDVPNSRYVVTP